MEFQNHLHVEMSDTQNHQELNRNRFYIQNMYHTLSSRCTARLFKFQICDWYEFK